MSREGAKRDNKSKPDLSLLPYCFEVELARVMMQGERKYGRLNYLKGHAITSLIASMKRHIGKLLAGQDIDEETGCSHWAHIAAGVLMALHQQEFGTLRDDRPRREDFNGHQKTGRGRPCKAGGGQGEKRGGKRRNTARGKRRDGNR